MSGHLFILNQRQITGTVAESKKVPVSAKQWEAGANEIKADDLIFLAVGKKDGPVILWLTAKAATGAVKAANGGYVRLSFVRPKASTSAYALIDGIATGQSLRDLNWKKLDAQEASACFLDTNLCDKALTNLRNSLSRSIPKGLGIDSDSVLRSVLLNGAAGVSKPVMRGWYDSELLITESKYRKVLKKRLSEIDGVAFETLMAEFFRHPSFGFESVRMTKRTNDDGIDLLLTQQDDVFGPLLIIGQCKRRKSTISVDEVRVLTAVRSTAKAGRAIFITTSHFSQQAENVAIQDGHIELIDGDKLANLLFRHAEKTPEIWDLIKHSVQLPLY